MTPMAEFLVLFDLKCDARFCAALCQFCAAEFLSRLRHVRRISRNALVLNSSPMHKLRTIGKEWKSPSDERQGSDLTGFVWLRG
jgi:hypothetical protein